MTTVREVMSTDVVRVSPELSVRQLAELIASKRLCCVAVTDGWGGISGVATATDVLDALANMPSAPPARMTPEFGELPFDVEAPDDYEDRPTASFYSEMYEDAGAEVTTRIDSTGSPEWDVMDEVTVTEVMSRQLHTIAPGASIGEAARTMDKLGIQRLLVIERGDLLGLISTADVSRAVARGILAG